MIEYYVGVGLGYPTPYVTVYNKVKSIYKKEIEYWLNFEMHIRVYLYYNYAHYNL